MAMPLHRRGRHDSSPSKQFPTSPYLLGLGALLFGAFPVIATYAGFTHDQAVNLSGTMLAAIALMAEMHLAKLLCGALTTVVTAAVVVIVIRRRRS